MHLRLHRADEEVRRRHVVGALDALQRDAAVEQQQHSGQLRGRLAVHQAADGRAAVADGRVRDQPQRLAQQRRRVVHLTVVLEPAVPHERADADDVRMHLDVGETGHVVDVHDVPGRGQPHRHQRDQALPAREHLGVLAQPGEGVEGLPDTARPVIGEGGWLHGGETSSCRRRFRGPRRRNRPRDGPPGGRPPSSCRRPSPSARSRWRGGSRAPRPGCRARCRTG